MLIEKFSPLMALFHCMMGYLIHSAIDQLWSARSAAIANVLGPQSLDSSSTRSVRIGLPKL